MSENINSAILIFNVVWDVSRLVLIIYFILKLNQILLVLLNETNFMFDMNVIYSVQLGRLISFWINFIEKLEYCL